jgi:hypothetical protein
MKFSGLNTNYLTDWHAAAASITKVAPLGVSSRWKSQITAGMISFGSLLASPFFSFPFRGSRLRENYFLLHHGLFSHQFIRTTALLWLGWKVFLIKFTQSRGGAVVDNAVSFLYVFSSNPCYRKLFLQHFVTNSRKQVVSWSLLMNVLPA